MRLNLGRPTGMLSPHVSSCMYLLGRPAHTGPNPKPPAVLFSRYSSGHAVQVLCFKCLQVKRRKSSLFHYHRAGPVGAQDHRAGLVSGGWAGTQNRAHGGVGQNHRAGLV